MPTDPIAPPVNAGKSPQTAPGQRARRSGLGWSSQIIMGSIVLTLLVIALPKQCTQNFPFLPVPLSAPAAKPALIPIPAPSSVPTVVAAPSWPAPVDDAKAISDIAKMTLDASKDKYDSIKDTYDKLFSVLAAMAALLAFLGFKGLDSLVAARNEAQTSKQLAQAAFLHELPAQKWSDLKMVQPLSQAVGRLSENRRWFIDFSNCTAIQRRCQIKIYHNAATFSWPTQKNRVSACLHCTERKKGFQKRKYGLDSPTSSANRHKFISDEVWSLPPQPPASSEKAACWSCPSALTISGSAACRTAFRV